MFLPSRTSALMSGGLAALGWGLTGTFIKLMPEFSTLEVLAIRLIVALLITLPVLVINASLRTQFFALIRTPMGLSLSSLMVFYYLFAVRAFQLAPVSDVVLIVGLSPLIGLTVKAALKHPVALREGGGAGIAFIGLLLFVWPKLQGAAGQSTYLTGLFFALLSACVSLGYASLFKYYAGYKTSLNPIAVTFVTFMLGSVVVGGIVGAASPQWINRIQQSNTVWIALGLGTVSTVVPTLCYSYAAKHLSPVVTTILNLLTPIFAAIIAVFLLKEAFPFISLIGAALIISGILLLSLPGPIRSQQ